MKSIALPIFSRTLTAALLLALAAGTRSVAAQSTGPQLGSPDFKATVERPVSWRGDGTGRFPAATPPTTWERTRNGAAYETKGILWMSPLPNNGVSCPIVVG